MLCQAWTGGRPDRQTYRQNYDGLKDRQYIHTFSEKDLLTDR